MKPKIDERVLEVQQWLNKTYYKDNSDDFNKVKEDGITGWSTIYALRRALQIELGISPTSNNFGPTTYAKCPNINLNDRGNLVYIVQGGLWCKGYSPGGFDGIYGNATYSAVQTLKTDMGFPLSSGNINRDVMKALLDMSAFVIPGEETAQKIKIREIQQKLNYDYYDYYQICPCDGSYNRDMNKMLIYALQKELGIEKNSATGSWGPTTVSLAKKKSFSIGDSDEIVKLIRYATICNGYTNIEVSSSKIYDSKLDGELEKFAQSLQLNKPLNKVNYTIFKSLLSSNGDTDRPALGCDTATKLNSNQIQTIINAGYNFVGRYITNTPGSEFDKCLTRTEMENILNAGLKIIYLFQEANNKPEVFTLRKGEEQAARAIFAMDSLGAPSNSVIYFAVDCDPVGTDITNYIIPYFKGIIGRFKEENTSYKIGVYGTRNVCTSLDKAFSTTIKFYVSDASYGFSGNLGFTMPREWAFDQFCTDITIGSGIGRVSIDKVGVSGKDNAEYGPLRNFDENYNNDAVVYTPTSAQKNAKGRLYVNMGDNLHIYNKIFSSKEYMNDTISVCEEHAIPKDSDLMYTLPKYAMYVNLGVVLDDDILEKFGRCTYLIKFVDNEGNIKYGYIPVNNRFPIYSEGANHYIIPVSKQVEKDIENYGNQREFTNYIVDESYTKLVPSSRTTIDGSSCVIYRLNSEVKLYDASAVYQRVLPKDTKVALSTCDTGKTHNELIYVHRIFNEKTKKWEKPLKSSNSFITYKLEQGCMPNDRVISN